METKIEEVDNITIEVKIKEEEEVTNHVETITTLIKTGISKDMDNKDKVDNIMDKILQCKSNLLNKNSSNSSSK